MGISGMAKLELVLKGIKMVQATMQATPRVRQKVTPQLLQIMKAAASGGIGAGWKDAMGSIHSLLLWILEVMGHLALLIWGHLSGLAGQPEHTTSLDKSLKDRPLQSRRGYLRGQNRNQPLPSDSHMLEYLVARGSVFQFKDGRPQSEVRGGSTCGTVESMSGQGHSFCSGAATSAARQGVGDATIKLLGRWTYQLYIKIPGEQLAAFSKKLSPVESDQD
jgi:hypothetical protein